MKAYIFPGQGAQFTGMGLDLYEKSPLAQKYFEKANDILEQYKKKRWSKEEFVLPELNNANLSDEKDVYRKIITATKKNIINGSRN